MTTVRSRAVLIAGISLLSMLGYWSGIGYYIRITTSLVNPAKLLYVSNRINSTDIYRSRVFSSIPYSISSEFYNGTSYTAQTHNNSLKVNAISTTSERVSSVSTIKVGNTTVMFSTSQDSLTMVNSNTTPSVNLTTQKKQLYITPLYMRDGRLGNQMFRYASMLGIALSQGRTLVIPPGSELEGTFSLHYVREQDPAGWQVTNEDHAYMFTSRLMNLTLQNLKIYGFLQSYKYFKDFNDEVRKEFVFRESIVNESLKILKPLYVKYNNSLFVGIHVRRGDFLYAEKQVLGYAAPEKSYFAKAFDWFKLKFRRKKIIYLVASDDFNWCRDNIIGDNVIALPDAEPAVHLAVLSRCKHMIVSGGTFGWWAAWLTGGKVIFFTGFMAKGTTFGDQFVSEDYYPPTWTGFGN